MKTNKITSYTIGIILFLIGIFMSLYQHNPHFYTPFSIGLFIITLNIYNFLAKKPLFNKWKMKQHLIFWISLIVICIIIDKIGMQLNYWYYPSYSTILDEIIKITFEYAVPFMYFMLMLLIGTTLLVKLKLKLNSKMSFTLSLLIVVPLTLLFTEHINSFSNSWQVTGISNLIWFSIGSWLMAIIPLIVYKFTEQIK
jgi:hypothetical protein